MKNILKYIGIWIILILFFIMFLILGCTFPSSSIKRNVFKSAEILLREGNFYTLLNHYEVDNFTDSIMINQAYSVNNKKIIYSALAGIRNYNPKTNKEIVKDNELLNENVKSFYNDQTKMLYKLSKDEKDVTIRN